MHTIFVSILGREFGTAVEALADEDRLPDLIAEHRAHMKKFVVGAVYAGKLLTVESAAARRSHWNASIADYEQKWAEVQAQRAARGAP